MSIYIKYLIYNHILSITFLNDPKLIFFTELNDPTVLFLTIQFSISHLFAQSLNSKVLFGP